jgi:hypothetical protein
MVKETKLYDMLGVRKSMHKAGESKGGDSNVED